MTPKELKTIANATWQIPMYGIAFILTFSGLLNVIGVLLTIPIWLFNKKSFGETQPYKAIDELYKELSKTEWWF